MTKHKRYYIRSIKFEFVAYIYKSTIFEHKMQPLIIKNKFYFIYNVFPFFLGIISIQPVWVRNTGCKFKGGGRGNFIGVIVRVLQNLKLFLLLVKFVIKSCFKLHFYMPLVNSPWVLVVTILNQIKWQEA